MSSLVARRNARRGVYHHDQRQPGATFHAPLCCDEEVMCSDDCKRFLRKYHCPPRRHFRYLWTRTIVAEADFKETDTRSVFNMIFADDPNMCCLKYLLGYDQCAIDKHILNTVLWVKNKTGADLSGVDYDKENGQWAAGALIMKPYYVSRKIGMAMVKDDASVVGQVHKCGFMIYVTQDTTIYGEWGGENGRVVPRGTIMEYGFWNFEEPCGSVVIHSQSAQPIIPCEGHLYDFFERVYARLTNSKEDQGMWGIAKGTSFTVEDCRCIHFCLRGVITFDAVPDCDPCDTFCEKEAERGVDSDSDSDSEDA